VQRAAKLALKAKDGGIKLEKTERERKEGE